LVPLILAEMPISSSSSGILPDITATIGGTPLVDLSRAAKHYGLKEGRILGKCEYLSCGASKKDRIAKQIILDALESGDLTPGQPVVELTSGNTGTVWNSDNRCYCVVPNCTMGRLVIIIS
jgi:threonine synthase